MSRMPMQGKVKVSVTYDCRGKRATKTFDDSYAARRFYAAKLKEGKNPNVHKYTDPSSNP